MIIPRDIAARLFYPLHKNPATAHSKRSEQIVSRVARAENWAIVYSIKARAGEPYLWVRIGSLDFGLNGGRAYVWKTDEIIATFDFDPKLPMSETFALLHRKAQELPETWEKTTPKRRVELKPKYKWRKTANRRREELLWSAESFPEDFGILLGAGVEYVGVTKRTFLNAVHQGRIAVVGFRGQRKFYSVDDVKRFAAKVDGNRRQAKKWN